MRWKIFALIMAFLLSTLIYSCNVVESGELSLDKENVGSFKEIVIYVSRDGDDDNDGLSVFSTIKSLQLAVERAREYYEEGYKVSVYVESGTFFPGEIMNGISSGVGVYVTNLRNVRIIGGWDRSFSLIVGKTVLCGSDGFQSFSNILFLKNVSEVSLMNFELKNGGSVDAYGGGIRIENGIGVIVSATKIVSNFGKYGGGVFVYNCRDILLDVIAAYNSSTFAGGAAYISTSMGVYVSGDIASNSSAYYGGGLFIEDVSFLKVASKLYNNVSFKGGGIYIDNYLFPVISTNYLSCDLMFNIAEFGGGVCMKDTSNIVLTGNTISNRASKGGGVYVSKSESIRIGSVISWNYATNEGGGIYVENSQSLVIEGYISNNVSFKGGALAVFDSKYLEISSLMNSNYGLIFGGGIFASNVSESSLGGVMKFNCAGSSGGGIFLSHVWSVIIDGDISANYSLEGGGVFLTFGLDVRILGTFEGNTATDGGGAYVSYLTNSYIGGHFLNNSASNLGGGICISKGFLNLIEGRIISNMSYGFGGGIAVLEHSYSKIKSEVVGNFAILAGGIYMSRCYDLELSSKVVHNSSYDYASGVFIHVVSYNEKYTLENSQILWNGVEFRPNSSIFISNEVPDFGEIKFVNNLIGGRSGNEEIAIGEFGCDVRGHVMISNIFVTNGLVNIYRDYNGSNISISEWIKINNPSSTGSSLSFDNFVTNI